jgi:hypothetical protein
MLLTLLRCRLGGKWRINTYRAVGSEVEGGDGICFCWAAREGGGMLIFTIRASERDGVTTAGSGFVIATFDAPLVSTSEGILGGGGRAHGTGWCGFLAKLGRVAKLTQILALGDEGS